MSEQQPPPRDQSFVSPVLKVDYPAGWAVLVERAEVVPAYIQILSVGTRERLARQPWTSGAPGFGVTTTRTDHPSAAAMVKAKELHPAGGREGLVATTFAGHDALWRLGNGEPTAWTWVFVVAHGYFHSLKWSSAWRDALQSAVIGSVRLLNPAEPAFLHGRVNG